MREKYSEDCMKSNYGFSDRPFKSSLEMQLMRSKEACEKIVSGKVNKTNGTKMLKVLNLNAEAIKLIMDSVNTKRTTMNNRLDA